MERYYKRWKKFWLVATIFSAFSTIFSYLNGAELMLSATLATLTIVADNRYEIFRIWEREYERESSGAGFIRD